MRRLSGLRPGPSRPGGKCFEGVYTECEYMCVLAITKLNGQKGSIHGDRVVRLVHGAGATPEMECSVSVCTTCKVNTALSWLPSTAMEGVAEARRDPVGGSTGRRSQDAADRQSIRQVDAGHVRSGSEIFPARGREVSALLARGRFCFLARRWRMHNQRLTCPNSCAMLPPNADRPHHARCGARRVTHPGKPTASATITMSSDVPHYRRRTACTRCGTSCYLGSAITADST